MSKKDEGRHQHQPGTPPSVQDEEEVSGSAPSVTSDDDVLNMVEEVAGEEPKPGQTIGDIVNKAEKARHRPPEKEETGEA